MRRDTILFRWERADSVDEHSKRLHITHNSTQSGQSTKSTQSGQSTKSTQSGQSTKSTRCHWLSLSHLWCCHFYWNQNGVHGLISQQPNWSHDLSVYYSTGLELTHVQTSSLQMHQMTMYSCCALSFVIVVCLHAAQHVQWMAAQCVEVPCHSAVTFSIVKPCWSHIWLVWAALY